jgi:hypothetical protein
VPFFTPRLSSYWIHLVTPVPSSLARPLAEGLRNEVVVKDTRIQAMIPQELLSCREAIRRALQRIAQEQVETCFHDAGRIIPPEWVYCDDAPYAGGTVRQAAYRARLAASPEQIWSGLECLGGSQGWYAHDWLWKLRGLGNKLLGGVGSDRGRRHPRQLRTGDVLDFWRVLEASPPRRLLLLAEMKARGEAVLEFQVEPAGPDQSELRLRAHFLPRGLGGLVYWQALLPLHDIIFTGLIMGLARQRGLDFTLPPQAFEPQTGLACRIK